MDDFLNKVPNWIRWVLFVPAGLIAGIAVYQLNKFALSFMMAFDFFPEWLSTILTDCSATFFGSSVAVLALAIFVPVWKVGFSIAASTINTVIAIVWFFTVLTLVNGGFRNVNMWWGGVATIMQIAGGWFAVYGIHKEVSEQLGD